MKKWCFLILLVYIVQCIKGQQVSIKTDCDNVWVLSGEYNVTYSVFTVDFENIKFELVNSPNFELVKAYNISKTESTFYEKGKEVTEYRTSTSFTLRAVKTGVIYKPQVDVVIADQKYRSPKEKLTVKGFPKLPPYLYDEN